MQDPTCTTEISSVVQRSDNVDNDEDGLKDQEDPDCMALKAMKPLKVLATMELTTTKMAGLMKMWLVQLQLIPKMMVLR